MSMSSPVFVPERRRSTSSNVKVRKLPAMEGGGRRSSTNESPMETPDRLAALDLPVKRDPLIPGLTTDTTPNSPPLAFGPLRQPAPDNDEAEQKADVLADWMMSFEMERGSFTSTIIECEVMLKQAKLSKYSAGHKAALMTAVAFDVFDKLIVVFGRYQDVMIELREVLASSVFVEPAPPLPHFNFSPDADKMPGRRSSAVASTTVIPPRVGLYFQLTPYYTVIQQMQHRVAAKEKQLEETSSQMRSQADQHASHQAASAERHSKELQDLQGLLNQCQEDIARLEEMGSQSALRDLFLRQPAETQYPIVLGLLEALSVGQRADLLGHLLKVVPWGYAKDMVVHTIHELHDTDMIGFMQLMLLTKSIMERLPQGMLRAILESLVVIDRCDKEVQVMDLQSAEQPTPHSGGDKPARRVAKKADAPPTAVAGSQAGPIMMTRAISQGSGTNGGGTSGHVAQAGIDGQDTNSDSPGNTQPASDSAVHSATPSETVSASASATASAAASRRASAQDPATTAAAAGRAGAGKLELGESSSSALGLGAQGSVSRGVGKAGTSGAAGGASAAAAGTSSTSLSNSGKADGTGNDGTHPGGRRPRVQSMDDSLTAGISTSRSTKKLAQGTSNSDMRTPKGSKLVKRNPPGTGGLDVAFMARDSDGDMVSARDNEHEEDDDDEDEGDEEADDDGEEDVDADGTSGGKSKPGAGAGKTGRAGGAKQQGAAAGGAGAGSGEAAGTDDSSLNEMLGKLRPVYAGSSLDEQQAVLRALLSTMDLSALQEVLGSLPGLSGAVNGGAAGDGAAGGGGKPEDSKDLRIALPFDKYKRRPGAAIKKVQLSVAKSLLLIYDCWHKKIIADEADDRVGNRRQSLPDFVKDFTLHKYGLPAIGDAYLFALVKHISKRSNTKRRLRVFGVACGVIKSHIYSERLCNVVLKFFKSVFTKFTSATLRARKDTECFQVLTTVLEALDAIVPSSASSSAPDVMVLTEGRRESFIEAVKAAAIPAEAASGPPPEGHSSEGIRQTDLVVDVDQVLCLLLDAWEAQYNTDKALLQEVFHQYDTDHNGEMSLQEFQRLLAAAIDRPLTMKDILFLFNEMCAVSPTGTSIDAAAFASSCLKYGLSPHAALDQSEG